MSYSWMNVKKYRVRFVSPRKTVIIYDTSLARAKLKACKEHDRNWNDCIEIYRV
jgi:hypothetical protein